MPQFRKDPLTGRWVIVAEERFDRPNQFDIDHIHGSDDSDIMLCPFCPGNEDQTTGEIDRFDSTSGWAVRVLPNKYPALVPFEEYPDYKSFHSPYGSMIDVDTPLTQYEDSFAMPVPGTGTHEVIVDSPRHVLCLTELSDEEVFDVFMMYRQRLRALRAKKQYAHALIFKNVGPGAGASLYHSHTQLLGMPFLSPPIQRELQRAIDFRREMDECFWCTHIAHEIKDSVRIVEERQHFVSLCPYVSRFPAETAIYPKSHLSHFEQMNDEMVRECAAMVRQTILLLDKAIDWYDGRLSYNMIIKSGPFVYSGPMKASDISDSAFWLKRLDYSYENVYHFHIIILPSLAKAAGFEWGSGMHINPISPEMSAKRLRETLHTLTISKERQKADDCF